MKKILIILLVMIIGISSQGRIVSRPAVRSVSRVRVSAPKPRVSTFKASTPSRSSSGTSSSKAKITSVKPISNTTSTTKKSSFFTSSQPSKPKIEPKSTISSLNSSESKATNTVIYRDSDSNSNFWNNFFFYNMLFNRDNKINSPAAVPVKNEKSLTSDQELIKALEQKLNKVKAEKTGTIELVRSLEKTIELLKNNLSLSK